jgi:Ca2+-binding RTX toxin-like protein
LTVSLATSSAQNTLGSGLDELMSIDNFIGSSHADTLTGDAGANVLEGGVGADTLTGLGGNDTFSGGANAEVFLFGSPSGRDVIKDFSVGQGGRISLLTNLNGSGITDGALALSNLSDVLGNAVRDLGGGHTVTLTGVLTADLSAVDFLFFA